MNKKVRKNLEEELNDLTESLREIDVMQEKDTYNQTMKHIKDIKKLLSEDEAEKDQKIQQYERLKFEESKVELERNKFEYQQAKDQKESEKNLAEALENKKQHRWDNVLRITGIIVPVAASLLHLTMSLTVQYRDAERPTPEFRDAIKYVRTGK